MPGFKNNLSQLGEQIGPAPSWGHFAGDVASETLLNVPPMLGVGGLLGAGLGAVASTLTGHKAGPGAMIGAGAGIGGVGGMAAGSALAQAIAKLGGPMMGLNSLQTHALMNRADVGGSVAGGLLGAGIGGYMGHRKNEKEAMFGMGDPGRNAVPGANLLQRRVGATDAIEKLQAAHRAAATAKIGIKQPPAAPAAAPANKPQELGAWMSPAMRAAMEANMKSSSLRKIAADILNSVPAYTGKHMVEAGKSYENILPYAGLSAAAGGGAGYLLGDPAAGIGGAGGAVLGGAAGNILGTGLGALGGAALGHASGMTGPTYQKMIDEWAHGGSHVGNVLGSLYGGYKGIGLARRISKDREGKEAAARVVMKMAAQDPAAYGAYARAAMRAAKANPYGNVSPGVLNYMRHSTPTQIRQDAQLAGIGPATAPSAPAAAASRQMTGIGGPNFLPVGAQGQRGFTLVTPPTMVHSTKPTATSGKPQGGSTGVMTPTPGKSPTQLSVPVAQVAPTPPTAQVAPAAAGALPAGAEPPAKSTASWLSGLSTPSLGWKGKSLLYGGLGAAGLAAIANIMYQGDRHRMADREGDLRNMESRDFLGKQHTMELERQHALMERIKHPMDYYDPATRVS